MALLTIGGLDRPELSEYLERIPLDGGTMQQGMPAATYLSMLNDIGDIFEAVAAIASYETPKADPIRRHLQMHKFDANRIEAYLGALSEYANLLIRRCGLSEQEVFDMLKLSHMDARVKIEHNLAEGRVATTRKRPFSALDTDLESSEEPAAGRPRSLTASSQARPVPRLPPVVEDLRFSHIKNKKWSNCDRCTKRVDFVNQSYPHDGDWLVSKRDQKIYTFEARWEAGENFYWYCIPCLAQAEGYGTGPRARRSVQDARSLTKHAENRASRYANHHRRGR